MSDYIFGSAFEVWKSELDAINQEASVLLAAARQASVKEDRRALQTQYAALVERRNTAIRKLLHSAFPRRYSIASEKPAELTGQGTRSADARAPANSFSPPALASAASKKCRPSKIDTEDDPGTTCRLNELRQAHKETVVLNGDDGWIGDKPAQDDCQSLPYKGMDKNFAPESRKLAQRSDAKFEEVVAEARDSITRAGRSVMCLLGIKGGRQEDTIETGPSEQTVATDSCSSSSEGPSTELPQGLPSTDAAAVDCSLDATSEALFEESLNSDPDDELLRILSGEGPNRDLDEVIRGLSGASSNSGHPEIGPPSGRTSDFDIAPPAFQGAPISARILPLCRVQCRPHYPASSPRR
jgi:hypothetical protein